MFLNSGTLSWKVFWRIQCWSGTYFLCSKEGFADFEVAISRTLVVQEHWEALPEFRLRGTESCADTHSERQPLFQGPAPQANPSPYHNCLTGFPSVSWVPIWHEGDTLASIKGISHLKEEITPSLQLVNSSKNELNQMLLSPWYWHTW